MALPDLQPLEVSFGDVFEQIHPNNPLMIITDLYDNNSVNAQAIRSNDAGEETIVPGGGSTVREHIKTIVGHWDLQRMISAAERGYQVAYSQQSQKLRDAFIADMRVEFTAESLKPPTLLSPSSNPL